MSTSLPALTIRQRLGRKVWGPPQPFGPDGWHYEHKHERGAVIITCSDHEGYDVKIVHASMAFVDRQPTYEEMAHLHQAVWPNGWAYMVFAAPTEHVNIHENALHIWGARTGKPLLPSLSGFLPGVGRSI